MTAAVFNPRRVEQQVRNFERMIEAYDNHEPFSRFLTRFYKANKQMGSSDRRAASRLCYNYFRLGKALSHTEKLIKLTIAEFLCEEKSDVVGLYQPEWVAYQGKSIGDKVRFLEQIGFLIEGDLFPLADRLSAAIDRRNFELSHLKQPDLFIRVQTDAIEKVEKELTQNAIAFKREQGNAYRLDNGTRLQDLAKIKGLYEVQDLSSQQTIDFIPAANGRAWWDACAASGGKSLMLLDKYPNINLLVSDIRLSILRNLDERFMQAGIKNEYRKKVIDLSKDAFPVLGAERFDGVVLDVPCSGSGTWGRTPEAMLDFSESQIRTYTTLQKTICSNAIPFLKSGGTLTYITCSVFADENEEVVKHLVQEHGLTVEKMETIAGYTHGADSMFAALLRKV
ncbi:RsmB/NOP family class I SAM-dependent RNA methyltransferase [Sphingobacterium sp. UT-1RO-CII-1]|uniref:RsmB/NOP family class I SAM-dependent RNA methyltransferase n=1 Tax=Sphingobacterium sp. UT-1RO-CII-1 TaxID=2995225 RepID=UPI00227BBB51|nr:RsmB/NOP family class I SAM-dependent RNA methyltransferase [Sphingobacterium sp. UT-1RO-CII-1]MCY4779220.1 RsmB/NOP family class I SAM-dependent RNA methyltransferase [Sphingobacterium sp. UT-1RO-CII-1]